MTKYHYTKSEMAPGNVFYEATTYLSPGALRRLIDRLPSVKTNLHTPVVELEGRFVHAILLNGMRWDAHNREWKELSEFFASKETKPPLGIMPKKLWLEKRVDDLKEAVIRYIRVRRTDMTIVRKLLDEIVDTELELTMYEAEEKK